MLFSVPEWASGCTIPAMPSLTVQYNSDSATVELSRDCGEEGTRHMTCRGKNDRDFILNELTCIDEADSLGIGLDNAIKTTAGTLSDSHKKSLELIQNIPSDNNEDNAIDTHMNQIEQSSEKFVEKFNVEEIMFGDQPITPENLTTERDAEEVKPTKLTKKQLTKDKSQTKNAKILLPGSRITSKLNDELMMGDQPALTLEEIVKEDTKEQDEKSGKNIFLNEAATKESVIVENTSEASVTSDATTATQKQEISTETITKTSTVLPTVVASTSPQAAAKQIEEISSPTIRSTIETETTANSLTTAAIKITKKSFNTVKRTSIDNDEVLLLNNKEKKHEDSALTNDHFIPPMLLVRTMFTSVNPHAEHNETDKNVINETDASLVPSVPNVSNEINSSTPTEVKADLIASTTQQQTITSTEPPSSPTTIVAATVMSRMELTTIGSTNVPNASTSSPPATTVNAEAQTTSIASLSLALVGSTAHETVTTLASVSSIATETSPIASTTVTLATEEATTLHTTHSQPQQPDTPHIRPPHAPKYSGESSQQQHAINQSPLTTTTVTASSTVVELTTLKPTEMPATTINTALTNDTQTATISPETDKNQKFVASTIGTPAITENDQSIATESASNLVTIGKSEKLVASSEQTAPPPTTLISSSTENAMPAKLESISTTAASELPNATTVSDLLSIDTHAKDFNNSENYQPYRPNRRRSLTKPESRSYVKKIFG